MLKHLFFLYSVEEELKGISKDVINVLVIKKCFVIYVNKKVIDNLCVRTDGADIIQRYVLKTSFKIANFLIFLFEIKLKFCEHSRQQPTRH